MKHYKRWWRHGDPTHVPDRSEWTAKGWERRHPDSNDGETKECSACGRRLPLAEFYTKKGRSRDLYSACRSCHRERTRDWKEQNRSQIAVAARDAHLRKLGLTVEEFDARLASQGGVCAICGEGSERWHVDHDHSCCPPAHACSLCIRGILCVRCNIGLGYFRENPEVLTAAVAYLST